MGKKTSNKFPKGFFTQPRPTVSTKEALKDVIPMKWELNDGKNKKRIVLVSPKEKGIVR